MKTLQVAIEDREWIRFGLTQERLSFAELEEMIHQAYAREAVTKYHDLDALAGTWREEDAAEFARNCAAFEKIDEALWQ